MVVMMFNPDDLPKLAPSDPDRLPLVLLKLTRQTEFPLVCEVAHFGNYPPGYAELTAEINALEAELGGYDV
jgi:hypothetical protein